MPLILFALTLTNLNAYLDPGTGSLLLSSIVAIFATFIYFFKNLFYKIKEILLSGMPYRPNALKISTATLDSHQNPNAIVFYCEGARYYGTFKPILDTLDSLNHPYTYLTSDEADPALKRESKNSLIEFIGVGNKAYTRLNMLKADICIMTTPSLQVLQIKRSRGVKHYCHIVHSLLPMTYRVFALDYFDSVLVANEVQENFVCEVEKAHNVKRKYIAIVGSTYLDELAILREKLTNFTFSCHTERSEVSKSLESKSNIESMTKKQINQTNPNLQHCDSHNLTPRDLDSSLQATLSAQNDKNNKMRKTILISPSWGKESLLSKYGLSLLEPLAKSPYNIVIRPHPQSLIGETESANIKHLQNTLSNYKNVKWDIGTPNVIAFAKADLMISDFSGVIFDFVCLEGKPVITMDFSFDSAGYDLADIYDESDIGEFWTFKTLKNIGGKISENDFANLQTIIDSAIQSSTNGVNLANIAKTLWQHPHNSGIQSTIEILKIEKSLLESRVDKNILNRLDSTKNAILALESHESNSKSHTDSHKRIAK